MVEIKIVAYSPEEISAVSECLDTLATIRMATAIKSVVGEPTDRHASTAQHGVALEGSSNPVQSQPVSSFSGDAAGSSEVAGDVSETASASPAAAEQADKPARRGRKPKEAAAEPQKESATSADAAADTTSAAPVAQSASPSLDDARDALQAYSLKHGMPKAIELLGKFNAARISEVAEDRRAEFIEAAQV